MRKFAKHPRPAAIPAAIVMLLFVTPSTRAAPVAYDFMIASPSGVATTTASVVANTTGSLIGNWDATTNPTGTRTKPGLAGTFGDTENVAVPATINLSTSGAPSIPTAGQFAMSIDNLSNLIEMSGYTMFQSAAASGSLAVSATVTTASFRTRSPTSTYIGGIPVNLPLGNATITSLDIVQNGSVTGTISPARVPGQFDFTIAPLVDITLGVNLSGSDLKLGPVSTLLPMQGTLELSGNNATFTSLAPLDISQMADPALPLPPIPFALPTILPPGDTANVILNLTLDHLSTALSGSVSTFANGTIVPEPGGALLLLSSGICIGFSARRGRGLRESRLARRRN